MKCSCGEEASCRIAYLQDTDEMAIPIPDEKTVISCKKHVLEAIFNLGRGVTIMIRDLRSRSVDKKPETVEEVMEYVSKILDQGCKAFIGQELDKEALERTKKVIHDALEKLSTSPGWMEIMKLQSIDVGVKKGEGDQEFIMFPRNVHTAMLMIGLDPFLNPPKKISDTEWEQGGLIFVDDGTEGIKYRAKMPVKHFVFNFTFEGGSDEQ